MGDSEQGRNKGATGRGESERRPGRLGNVKLPLSWRRLSARSGVQCQMHPFRVASSCGRGVWNYPIRRLSTRHVSRRSLLRLPLVLPQERWRDHFWSLRLLLQCLLKPPGGASAQRADSRATQATRPESQLTVFGNDYSLWAWLSCALLVVEHHLWTHQCDNQNCLQKWPSNPLEGKITQEWADLHRV